jgi:hypothetical protein
MQILFHSIIHDHISHIILHIHLLCFECFLMNADDFKLDKLLVKSYSICILLDVEMFLIFILHYDMIFTDN